jgi:hypothetical protein
MKNADDLKRTHGIRVLNDFFRSTFVGGQVVVTPGVAGLRLDLR